MSSDPAPTATASLLVTRSRSKIQLAFTVIYLVWGVTYAVNRIMALVLPPSWQPAHDSCLRVSSSQPSHAGAAFACPATCVTGARLRPRPSSGWLLLDERLDALQLIGSSLCLRV